MRHNDWDYEKGYARVAGAYFVLRPHCPVPAIRYSYSGYMQALDTIAIYSWAHHDRWCAGWIMSPIFLSGNSQQASEAHHAQSRKSSSRASQPFGEHWD